MIIRNLGIVLLALGFVMLASAALIRDPTALDANIGAGALTLIGIPLGVLGLFLAAASDLYQRSRGRNGDHASVS